MTFITRDKLYLISHDQAGDEINITAVEDLVPLARCVAQGWEPVYGGAADVVATVEQVDPGCWNDFILAAKRLVESANRTD